MRLFTSDRAKHSQQPLSSSLPRALLFAVTFHALLHQAHAIPVVGGSFIVDLALGNLGLGSGLGDASSVSGLLGNSTLALPSGLSWDDDKDLAGSGSSYLSTGDVEDSDYGSGTAAAHPSRTHRATVSATSTSAPVFSHTASTSSRESSSATTNDLSDSKSTHSTSSRESSTVTDEFSDTMPTLSTTSRSASTTTHHRATSSATATASASAVFKSHNISNTHQFAADTLTDNKYAAFRLTSNQASYGPAEVRADLRKVMAWAHDMGNLNKAQEDETVAAILSVAARYYPELPTRAIARVLIADIKAESDFRPSLVSPGRLDSGDSWGLMQVSPDGMSQELNLFKTRARTNANSYSWIYQPSKGLTQMAQPGTPNAGPLLDWKTGKEMDLASLTKEDLFRPWVNVHVASWIQANLARTSSQDPHVWFTIAKAAQKTTITSQQLITAQKSAGNSTSSSGSKGFSFLSLNLGGIDISIPSLKSLKSTLLDDLAKETSLLVGPSKPRSVRSGLGSWVAGPATSDGGFEQDGDDISHQYLRAIVEGVSVVYGQTVKTTWLDGLKLNAGLVDYRTG